MITPATKERLKGVSSSSEKPRSISTRSSHKKLLGEALEANKARTAQVRRKRKRTVIEDEMEEQDMVEVSEEDDDDIAKAVEKKRKQVQGESSSKRKSGKRVKSIAKKRNVQPKKKKGSKMPVEMGIESEDPESPQEGEFDKVPDPSKELSREERSRILRTQRVLSGRVLDPEYAGKPGMCDLVDAIELQGWSHLFEWPAPTLHEKEIKDFYGNLVVNDDGSVDTAVNTHGIHLNEKILGAILKIPIKGIRLVTKTSPSPGFVNEILKFEAKKKGNVSKKFIKGTFQLFFEFVNKVLLPRSEKRTVATVSDLVLMEALSEMEDINLPAIMMEHIRKIMTIKDGKHGLAYGYLLGKVFVHNAIPLGVGTKGSIRQAITLTTLIECECVEDREGHKRKSQVSELLENQEQLRHELVMMSEMMQKKDIEIATLKAKSVESSAQGSGGSEELDTLRAENALLKNQNAQLSTKVDELKDKLIKSHDDSNARLSILLQNLQP